jgi:hypothetical protein
MCVLSVCLCVSSSKLYTRFWTNLAENALSKGFNFSLHPSSSLQNLLYLQLWKSWTIFWEIAHRANNLCIHKYIMHMKHKMNNSDERIYKPFQCSEYSAICKENNRLLLLLPNIFCKLAQAVKLLSYIRRYHVWISVGMRTIVTEDFLTVSRPIAK